MTMNLDTSAYLEPTPAGAFYAASSSHMEPARRLLFGILAQNRCPIADSDRLTNWSGLDQQATVGLVSRLQDLGWLTGLDSPLSAPVGPLEDVLPELLKQVSFTGKTLLADNQGFYLATSGIPHETAEALSAVSADLGSLYERHQHLLANNLGLNQQAWTLADASGNSQLGFWPLHIGQQRFVLVIEDRPCLNQPAFRDLVWTLTLRYSTEKLWENQTDNG